MFTMATTTDGPEATRPLLPNSPGEQDNMMSQILVNPNPNFGSELTIQSSTLLIEDRKAPPDKWSEVNQDNLIFTYCTIRCCLVPTGKLAWLRLCNSPCCFISSNANGERGTTCTPCTPSKAVLGFIELWAPICNLAISQLNMTDCQH